jgi:hypothetical protein
MEFKSKYDSYYEVLNNYLSHFPSNPPVLIDIDIPNVDGYAHFKFNIKLLEADLKTILDKPLITLWTDWEYDNPLLFKCRKAPISIEDFEYSNTVEIKYEYNESTVFTVTRVNSNTNSFLISFYSCNAIIPLSESTPYNRFILHLNLSLNPLINSDFQLRIIRNGKIVSKFTKGNYFFSFPSRTRGDERISVISFPKNNSYHLKYGMAENSGTQLTHSWEVLLKAGFILILVWALLSLESSVLAFFGAIAALIVALTQNISEYFYTTRLKYYTGKYDLNSIFSFTAFFNISLSIILVVLYYHDYLLIKIILIQSLTLVLTGVIGLSLLRIGFWEKYICDNINCNSRLYMRYLSRNCFYTGRVVCNKCYNKYCLNCYYVNSNIIDKTQGLPCMDPVLMKEG